MKKKLSFFSFPISFLFEYLEKKQLQKANNLIIISNDWEQKLLSWNINNEKIKYIPNWGDIKNIEYLEKKAFKHNYILYCYSILINCYGKN